MSFLHSHPVVATMTGIASLGFALLTLRRGNFGALRIFTRSYKVTREVEMNGKLEKIEQTIIPISQRGLNNLSVTRFNWLHTKDKTIFSAIKTAFPNLLK